MKGVIGVRVIQTSTVRKSIEKTKNKKAKKEYRKPPRETFLRIRVLCLVFLTLLFCPLFFGTPVINSTSHFKILLSSNFTKWLSYSYLSL